jgi:hypothetical protein
MKKIFVTILGIIFFTAVSAQKEPLQTPFAVPVDTITKLIAYEGVVEVKETSAEELYKRLLGWFNTYYKNPTEVIRENDSIKYKIVGKPRFRMTNPADKEGLKTDAGNIQYTINVATKGGRYRYELTEFNWKQISYYPCERWLDTKAAGYLPVYNDYLQQLDKMAHDVINSLKNAASHEKSVKDRDNW